MAHDDETTAVIFSTYIQSTGLNICLSATVSEVISGRKSKKSASSQGTPRTQNPRGGGNQSAIKLGPLSGGSMSFTKHLARSAGNMAIAKCSSGRGPYVKPSKPRTGHFKLNPRFGTVLRKISQKILTRKYRYTRTA